ncbi:NAD(P)-binding protein [Polychaeton citri CBS 116435]|uniref:NAD(P)-binding protein n=1 Tax=Polychaeton citri CBS 116435 TaxID=1314669 RepID=A0A9P4Q8C8_9PEZI|nr:NAD(P)-binding protein [Polychaeton citri CBS 116435]
MSESMHVRNVIIVGASGNVGSATLDNLNTASKFSITVLTRSESSSSFPSNVTVKRVSYSDPAGLEEAFRNQDAAIFAISFRATDDQPRLIEAAAKAGVKWILPNEYAGDGMNKAMVDAVPVFQPKRDARQQIEELAKTYNGLKWVGICTGPWLESSLKFAVLFDIDVQGKKVQTWEKPGRFNVSTIAQIGRAITALLSLPVSNTEDPYASLEHYANRFIYVSSFYTTQDELLAAVQRATGSSPEDWTRHHTGELRFAKGKQLIKDGAPVMQNPHITFGAYMEEGAGGDVEAMAIEDRRVLRLPQEDLDAAVKAAVASVGA